MTAKNGRKHAYTVPCASAFRDAALALARGRGVNVADLARSVVLMVPEDVLAGWPDPGGPGARDRETVILKSGPAEGRPWRRKPRLQVRMAPGLDIPAIRRALSLALAIDRGEVGIVVGAAAAADEARPGDTGEELVRLRAMVSALAFEPLAGGVGSRADALHVLGFPPASLPDQSAVRQRFRMLAAIHHPDSGLGSHDRMCQLNAAVERLLGGPV